MCEKKGLVDISWQRFPNIIQAVPQSEVSRINQAAAPAQAEYAAVHGGEKQLIIPVHLFV